MHSYIGRYIYAHRCICRCVNTCVYNKDKYRYSQTGDAASVLEGRKVCRKGLVFLNKGGKGSKGVDGMIYHYT